MRNTSGRVPRRAPNEAGGDRLLFSLGQSDRAFPAAGQEPAAYFRSPIAVRSQLRFCRRAVAPRWSSAGQQSLLLESPSSHSTQSAHRFRREISSLAELTCPARAPFVLVDPLAGRIMRSEFARRHSAMRTATKGENLSAEAPRASDGSRRAPALALKRQIRHHRISQGDRVTG